ncbi:hypothetical protein [Nocardia sp. NPDC057668]|uniref:hypothetical protein n=1 Tax=Nocardia sp. NPDC057668 TaxID=3346202 RepID=UPI003671E363
MGWLCVLIVVGFVGLMMLAAARSARAERERVDRLYHWAAAAGWRVYHRSDAPWTDRLPGGHRHGIDISLVGRLGGHWVTVAEYSYQTFHTRSSGDSTVTDTTTHRYVVTVVHLDRQYPPLEVRAQGMWSLLGRALFGDRKTATGNPLFDCTFRIDAGDPAYAKAMVGPHLIEAHVAGAVPLWSLAGTDLLTYVPNAQLHDPRAIPGYAAPLLRVADLLGHREFGSLWNSDQSR